jgi:tetratricopeptide (TPR) repeat protein
MSVAERLRELREDAGLSKTALARPRYTVSYISQIEAGRRKPSPEALGFFAQKLGVTPAYLATGVPDDLEESLGYQLEEARRLIRQAQGAQAERIVRPVVSQATQYGLDVIYARASAVLGEAFVLQRRMREAIEAFEEALAGEGLSEREAGVTTSGLARAYRDAGDLTYAAELVEGFLAKREGGPLDPGVAADLQGVLVSIYFERGDMLRAERAAKRALTAARDCSIEVQAGACWDASRVLAEAKKWDEALDLATRARILMEQLDNQRNVARLHNAYGYLCLEADPPRTEEAALHLARAEELLEEFSAPGDLAYVFAEKGRLALLKKRPEEAIEEANRALAEPGIDELETARCLYLRGRACGTLERRKEARLDLTRAAILFGNLGARQQEAGCWRELGELDLAAGDVDAAVKALRAGLEALDPRRSRA